MFFPDNYPILYDTINIFIYSHFIIACQLAQRLLQFVNDTQSLTSSKQHLLIIFKLCEKRISS